MSYLQDSPWSEYWYRFVRPCIHYIPFFTRAPDDLIDEVRSMFAHSTDQAAVKQCQPVPFRASAAIPSCRPLSSHSVERL